MSCADPPAPEAPALDVAAIRARCDRATPGPWVVHQGFDVDMDWFDYRAATPLPRTMFASEPLTIEDDAEFMAAAREDVPALLDALAAAQARAAELEGEVERQIQRAEDIHADRMRWAERRDDWMQRAVNAEAAMARVEALCDQREDGIRDSGVAGSTAIEAAISRGAAVVTTTSVRSALRGPSAELRPHCEHYDPFHNEGLCCRCGVDVRTDTGPCAGWLAPDHSGFAPADHDAPPAEPASGQEATDAR